MRVRNGKIALMLACLISIGGAINADAHGGRTDSNGGHKDNKNASGLGSYHYHCGGNPAHLHTNGCPYGNSGSSAAASSSGSNSSTNSGQSEVERKAQEAKKLEEEKKAEEVRIAKEKEEVNKMGYEAGISAGYEKQENGAAKYEGNNKESYVEGYDKGFQEGSNKINEEIKIAENKGFQSGKEGQENKNEFEKDILKEAYNSSYAKGIDEYMKTNIEKYRLKGEADAIDKKEAESLESSINEKFKEAYLSAYENKKSEIAQKEKDDTEAAILGVGAVAIAGGGVIVYRKKKKKKVS